MLIVNRALYYTQILLIFIALLPLKAEAISNDPKILLHTNQEKKMLATIIVPYSNEAGMTWVVYSDFINDASIIDSGIVGKSIFMNTFVINNKANPGMVAFLALFDSLGAPVDIVYSIYNNIPSDESEIIHKYGGVMVGAIIALISCLCVPIVQEIAKGKYHAEKNRKQLLSTTEVAICDLKSEWNSFNRDYQLPSVLEGDELYKLAIYFDDIEGILSEIAILKKIHKLWIKKNESENSKKELENLLDAIKKRKK